jgi:formamidopyrimidine-DNA glycosylase
LPELPEIEHLKRSLEPMLIGATVLEVDLRRRDIVHRFDTMAKRGAASIQLLEGAQISAIRRHGKNLALLGSSGRAICIHLGMSGQLVVMPARGRLSARDHVHCVWRIHGPSGDARLIFRDPRRFGGLWSFPTFRQLRQERWSRLGPDALAIKPKVLSERLASTHRFIKAALLDQSVLAGVGNIYADECLFQAGIHPASMADRLSESSVASLSQAITHILRTAIRAGGSTIRSYRDATGKSGTFVLQHRVYGRGGRPCVRCKAKLQRKVLVQRTTVFCSHCQERFR